MRPLKWQPDQIMDFLHAEFPQTFGQGETYAIKTLEPGRTRVSFMATEANLRPGRTVSGPALMQLVDISIYVLLLGHHGASAAMSVTTNLQISFLRKAEAGELFCDIELIKHGRTLSVADARIFSGADERLVANAEATYYMASAE